MFGFHAGWHKQLNVTHTSSHHQITWKQVTAHLTLFLLKYIPPDTASSQINA